VRTLVRPGVTCKRHLTHRPASSISCSEGTSFATAPLCELLIKLPPLMIKLAGRVLLLTSVPARWSSHLCR
jgi:hypothetical protein